MNPRQPIDLIPMCSRYRVSESASAFASHIHELHDEIRKTIERSNANYKLKADLKRRIKEFKIGDYVMVRIRPERFPPGAVKKLHARSAGPFRILKKINDNAFVLDLPADFNISQTFNIEDLIAYDGPDFNPDNPLHDEPHTTIPGESPSLPPLPDLPPLPTTDKIEEILTDDIISTTDGGRQRYLIRWKGKPVSEDTWVDRDELQRLDPDMLEMYDSLRDLHSTGSSSLPPGENDEDIRPHPRYVYQRRRRRGLMPTSALIY